MKEDHDMLDSAIDEAMVEVEKRSKSDEPQASAEDVPTPDESESTEPATETNEAEEKETSLDQEASAETTQDSAPETEAIEESKVDAPAFWSADEKAEFAKASPALREIIAKRELAAQQHISRLTNEARNGKGYESRFYADFESPEQIQLHKSKLAAAGISDPVAELHRYRAWDRVLESNPTAAIARLMKQNGLTPYDFTEEGAYQRENDQLNDPRVDEAIQRAEAAEARIKEFEEKQEQQRFSGIVNAYKSGTFSDGKPRAQFMAVYAPQITQAYESLSKLPDYQHLDEASRLHYATEYVRSQVNNLHGVSSEAPKKMEPPKKTREQIIEESKKAAAAATSTVGAPATGTPVNEKRSRLKGKTDRERIGSAIDLAIDRAMGA